MSSSPSSDECFSSDSPSPTLINIKREAYGDDGSHCKRSRATEREAETPAGSGEEDVNPNETEHDRAKRRRKEQRMHRNRLSAARSRQRKEDALETLSKENASLRDELNLLKSQLAAATSKGFAAVKHSNFIVLMKLAAMYLIYTAICVATIILVMTPPLLAVALPTLSFRRFLPPLSSSPHCATPPPLPRRRTASTVPQTTLGFAMAAMPYALPATPVR